MRTHEEILKSMDDNTKILEESNRLVKKMNKDLDELLEGEKKESITEKVKRWIGL